MPPKRAAAGSQAVFLNENSSHDDVLTFMSGLLTVEQFDKLTETWSQRDEEPTGEIVISYDQKALQGLGLHHKSATKISQILRSMAAQPGSIEADADGKEVTPVVDAADAGAVDLTTTAPTVPKRGRGRPPKARQPRLSQRLEAPAGADGDDDETEAMEIEDQEEDGSGSAGGSEDAGVADSPPAGRRNTRQRVSRMASVRRAAQRLEDEQGEWLQDAMEDTDVSSDEEIAAEPAYRRRGRRGAVSDPVEADEEDDARPDDPDDDVTPEGHDWEDGAREGLEDILKELKVEQLKNLVDEQLTWNVDHIYRYRRKNQFGQTVTATRKAGYIANKIVKMLFDGAARGRADTDHEIRHEAVDEILDKYVDESVVQAYLKVILKLRFATPPRISDTRKLLWRLWCRPRPPPGEFKFTLGNISFPLTFVGNKVVQYWEDTVGYWDKEEEPWMKTVHVAGAAQKGKELAENAAVAAAQALQNAQAAAEAAAAGEGVGDSSGLVIKDDPDGAGAQAVADALAALEAAQAAAAREQLEFPPVVDPKDTTETDWADIRESLVNLSQNARGHLEIRWRLDPKGMRLRAQVLVDLKKEGSVHISAAFKGRGANGEPHLTQVWLDKILQVMDHLQGTDTVEHDLEALNVSWDKACDELEKLNVDLNMNGELKDLDIATFDKVMATVEDLERPLQPGLVADCRAKVALRLRPYQLRALSFMLTEERAPGGTARHLWLNVPLPPGAPEGVQVHLSPSLYQLHVSRSPTAAGLTLGTTGGGGWQALEMGMGKTAVCIAGMVFNPPPVDWRRARPWTPYSAADYLLTKTENMPRGGTLVIVPTTLLRQWELEIVKTLRNPDELSILRWTDRTRTLDCREIAKYDVVLTTPQQVSKDGTLTSIYWHRAVIDEAQIGAGALMSSGELVATHRWVVSGTPVASRPETIAPSLEFLRLGGYTDSCRFLPPAMATTLRAVMLRYTMSGKIDGERNLDLPPLIEKVIGVNLDEDDEADERDAKRQNYELFRKKLTAAKNRAGVPQSTSLDAYLIDRQALKALAETPHINMRVLNTIVDKMRAIVAGGKAVPVPGVFEYNARTGEEELKMRFFSSKAAAVVACIEDLRTKDPNAKVLVFSQYEETLRTVARLLPDIGMDFRAIFGGTSMKKRGEAIESFMTDPPTRVFLLTAKSGSVGITLTAASHVFICEPLMDESLERQAVGRSRRMGQTKTVTVHRLYARDTIEARVRALIARRHQRGGAKPVSTLMAVNTEMTAIKNNIADVNEMLECELPQDEEEEEEEDAVVVVEEGGAAGSDEDGSGGGAYDDEEMDEEDNGGQVPVWH